ncbi:MAG: HD domain-containing protein [Pirellulales bacterium]|nr:HD domain-containing protein [Pirellulales bacterium]
MKLTSRFADALRFALQLHAEQRRKVGGAPYAAHLLGVAALVLECGSSEDEAIAAVLHDAVEDQGGAARLAEIRDRFGTAVAEIVAGASDADVSPKPPWRERKEAFLRRLAVASPAVRLIVAADKLHNVRCLTRDYRRCGEDLWRHFSGGRDGTLWYYQAVLETLKTHGKAPLVDELDRALNELTTLCS